MSNNNPNNENRQESEPSLSTGQANQTNVSTITNNNNNNRSNQTEQQTSAVQSQTEAAIVEQLFQNQVNFTAIERLQVNRQRLNSTPGSSQQIQSILSSNSTPVIVHNLANNAANNAA